MPGDVVLSAEAVTLISSVVGALWIALVGLAAYVAYNFRILMTGYKEHVEEIKKIFQDRITGIKQTCAEEMALIRRERDAACKERDEYQKLLEQRAREENSSKGADRG